MSLLLNFLYYIASTLTFIITILLILFLLGVFKGRSKKIRIYILILAFITLIYSFILYILSYGIQDLWLFFEGVVGLGALLFLIIFYLFKGNKGVK